MIVVTGANGNVGRPLVRALTGAGQRVTAVSRQGSAGAAAPDGVAPDGVAHRRADLGDPASLRTVLDGAEALFLFVAGDDPGGILDAASAAGVRKVVLLSSQGAGSRPEAYPHPRRFEQAVRDSELSWTILRPGGFNSNALRWAGSIRSDRTVAAPFGDVALPTIDPADIAEVAATALGTDAHAGHTVELTGPEPITPRQQARAIGEVLGADLRFVEQSREQARAALLRLMPGPVADATLAILGRPTADEGRVSPDVEKILGRPPGTFVGWATRTAAAFR